MGFARRCAAHRDYGISTFFSLSVILLRVFECLVVAPTSVVLITHSNTKALTGAFVLER
jgi:hypothetical protein